MKRVGYIYDKMAEWHRIVEAEAISTDRRLKNLGVRKHIASRWQNLCEIQQGIADRTIRTGDYQTDMVVSGQDKLRNIAKLKFHPSHIYHQLLTLVGEERADRMMIRHTYASRKGYGQVRAALQLKKNVRKKSGEKLWIWQGDIVKYYDNIPHTLLRSSLCHIFKDDEFIDAFMEPFEKYAPEGRGIPKGIRPSQLAGNICLAPLDRFATQEVHCRHWLRYLDDFVFTGESKWEVKRKGKRIEKFVRDHGFELHEPRVFEISAGMDMLGYVYHGTKKDMSWRKSNKRRWLKRRARVSNPKRLLEYDAAAWGMLKWGNGECKRLFEQKTGRKIIYRKNMAVSFKSSGIKVEERRDANGLRFIEYPPISMDTLKDKTVLVKDFVKGIKTEYGGGRYALHVVFYGDDYKLIANSCDIKQFVDILERNHVTLCETVFTDLGGKKFSVNYDRTRILEVSGRTVTESNGCVVFEDSGETVTLS